MSHVVPSSSRQSDAVHKLYVKSRGVISEQALSLDGTKVQKGGGLTELVLLLVIRSREVRG